MRVRNPFLLLAAEQIEFDTTFLDLFEPGALEVLQKRSDSLWNRVCIFRSSPGGGKTTLLRLFTPSALKTLHMFRDRENYKELYNRLKELNVLDEGGVRLLGVMLSCSRNRSYAGIEDLVFDENYEQNINKKKRLLFALLNCRIIISALKGLSELADLNFPDELDLVYIKSPQEDVPLHYPINCSGLELFNWAQKMEEEICSIIDDLMPIDNNGKLMDSMLSSLYIISPKNMLVNGSQIVERAVVMFDDFNELTPVQRETIMRTIISSRPPVGIWISERLEALSEREVLKDVLPGDRVGRDFEEIVLEKFWRDNPGRFEKVVLNIANRRIKYADVRGVSSFTECLSDKLDNEVWLKVLTHVSKKVEEKISKRRKYQKWLEFCKRLTNSFKNGAITWRALEILVDRDSQKTLSDFSEIGVDKILSAEEFTKQCGSDVKAAAELFISMEYNIPYYYGWSRIAKMSSFNIEQFIYLSAKLFEEFLSSSLISTSPKPLTPKQQEKILKKSVESRLSEIIDRMPKKENIKRFVDAIGNFARWETYKPNAPYSPGVTGIAIEMEDLDLLLKSPKYEDLALTISECIKQNLLLPVPNHKCKGRNWMVLYLNRMLCVKYGLPLHYGGWREKTLHELYIWLREGFKPKISKR